MGQKPDLLATLDDVAPVDNGSTILWITLGIVIVLLLLWIILTMWTGTANLDIVAAMTDPAQQVSAA